MEFYETKTLKDSPQNSETFVGRLGTIEASALCWHLKPLTTLMLHLVKHFLIITSFLFVLKEKIINISHFPMSICFTQRIVNQYLYRITGREVCILIYHHNTPFLFRKYN